MGFRSAPFHFASKNTHIYIISSADNGTNSWDLEHEIYLESDMREPYLFEYNGTLHFSYF